MDTDHLSHQDSSAVSDNDILAATTSLGEISFVDWKPDRELPQDGKKKTRARLYHKKSRNGCKECKSRKIKVNLFHQSCYSVLSPWRVSVPAQQPLLGKFRYAVIRIRPVATCISYRYKPLSSSVPFSFVFNDRNTILTMTV